jgi:16S rRNA (guanine(966)-N(2))-methyltransferase RsmD
MAALRVIRGKARGRRLRSVPGDATRPITDRVKEALFNIIGADIQGASFLDLFAGTGSVGIEALSSGAAFVRFLDRHRPAVETVRANLAHTGFEAQAQVLQGDAFQLLARPADRAFDYVYIAPPQYQGLWKQALLALDSRPDWMADDAWVIVQIHPKEYEEVALTALAAFDERRYGSTLLVFYERRSGDGDGQYEPDAGDAAGFPGDSAA